MIVNTNNSLPPSLLILITTGMHPSHQTMHQPDGSIKKTQQVLVICLSYNYTIGSICFKSKILWSLKLFL